MKLRDHLEKISDGVNELKVTTVKQQTILEEHMRRTAILEKQVKPITRVYHFFQVLVPVVAFLAVVVSIFK